MFTTRFAGVSFFVLVAAAWIGSEWTESSLAWAQVPKNATIKKLAEERLDVLKGVVKGYQGGIPRREGDVCRVCTGKRAVNDRGT